MNGRPATDRWDTALDWKCLGQSWYAGGDIAGRTRQLERRSSYSQSSAKARTWQYLVRTVNSLTVGAGRVRRDAARQQALEQLGQMHEGENRRCVVCLPQSQLTASCWVFHHVSPCPAVGPERLAIVLQRSHATVPGWSPWQDAGLGRCRTDSLSWLLLVASALVSR